MTDYIEINGERFYSSSIYESMRTRVQLAEQALEKRSAEIYNEGYMQCAKDSAAASQDPTAGIPMRINPYNEEMKLKFFPTLAGLGVEVIQNGLPTHSTTPPNSSAAMPRDNRVDAYGAPVYGITGHDMDFANSHLPKALRDIEDEEPPFHA